MYTDEALNEAGTLPPETDEHVEADATHAEVVVPLHDDQPYVAELDAAPAPVDDEVVETGEAPAEEAPADEASADEGPADEVRAEPVVAPETPFAASSRVLELATFTADQLVADARAQAETLVSTAQAEADDLRTTSNAEAEELRAASREAADRSAGELHRLREEQRADLERERTAALSDLGAEKAALEALVDGLRQQESDYRLRLRDQLHQHLALLDDGGTETTLSVAG